MTGKIRYYFGYKKYLTVIIVDGNYVVSKAANSKGLSSVYTSEVLRQLFPVSNSRYRPMCILKHVVFNRELGRKFGIGPWRVLSIELISRCYGACMEHVWSIP